MSVTTTISTGDWKATGSLQNAVPVQKSFRNTLLAMTSEHILAVSTALSTRIANTSLVLVLRDLVLNWHRVYPGEEGLVHKGFIRGRRVWLGTRITYTQQIRITTPTLLL